MTLRPALPHLALALALAAGASAPRAQQLVLNPGFEEYSRCPTGIGVFEGWVDVWHRTNGASTDFQHECGFIGRPSRSGQGHAGFLAYDFSANYREYATGEISPPLEAGQTYLLEFWVILDEGRLHAVEELGGWFSVTEPTWPGTGPPAGIVPDVEHSGGTLQDKLDWMLVSGRYVAAGGERFLTIGNFRDDASTTTTSWPCCGAYGAYYHLDDVSLVKDSPLQEPCLWRADLSGLAPPTPAPATLFMPPSPEMLSIAGPPWQCPIASGDDERDPDAAINGVPLAFYQVDRPVILRVAKSGTTLRFTF